MASDCLQAAESLGQCRNRVKRDIHRYLLENKQNLAQYKCRSPVSRLNFLYSHLLHKEPFLLWLN